MHTKGKWTIEVPCGFPYTGLYIVPVIRKDFPFYIAEIRQLREREESEANANHIVHCCNNFDTVVIALKAACKYIQQNTPASNRPVTLDNMIIEALADARQK